MPKKYEYRVSYLTEEDLRDLTREGWCFAGMFAQSPKALFEREVCGEPDAFTALHAAFSRFQKKWSSLTQANLLDEFTEETSEILHYIEALE